MTGTLQSLGDAAAGTSHPRRSAEALAKADMPWLVKAPERWECLPYVPDAWIDEGKTKIGYEISFTRYFYKPQPLRSLDEIKADILAAEKESEGLLEKIVGGQR